MGQGGRYRWKRSRLTTSTALFIPRRSVGVIEVEIDSDLVVIAGRMGQTHTLNPTAALIWQCLDGEGSLDDLIADLAEATSAPKP